MVAHDSEGAEPEKRMESDGGPHDIRVEQGAARTAIYVVRVWIEPDRRGGALRGNVRRLGGPVLGAFGSAGALCRIFNRLLATDPAFRQR